MNTVKTANNVNSIKGKTPVLTKDNHQNKRHQSNFRFQSLKFRGQPN